MSHQLYKMSGKYYNPSMKLNKIKLLRILVIVFIVAIIYVAARQNSYILATISGFTGLFFLVLVHSKTETAVDEREMAIREKAAQMTYGIFTPTIGIGSFLMIMYARGEYYFLESLGMVLAYLTLFLIALYAGSYYFFSRKFGGGGK